MFHQINEKYVFFSPRFKQYVISEFFLERLRLIFKEFPDENDLKSNLTNKINQRENTRDILVPRTTLQLSIFTLTLQNLKVASKRFFSI